MELRLGVNLLGIELRRFTNCYTSLVS